MTDAGKITPIPGEDECAKEPIHIPGSIQPHGFLFVLDSRDFVISQASENTANLLGISADELLGKSFLDLVASGAQSGVAALIHQAAASYVNPFRVPIITPGVRKTFDGIAHIVSDSVTILELEAGPDDELAGRAPTEALDNYLQLIQRSLGELSEIEDVTEVASLIAREVRNFTGFDRVMVYRFAPDFHGEVIAEDKAEEMESYLGLHYPAGDIPPQARELYLKNQVRLLHDVEARPALLIPQRHPSTGAPLDLSQSVLRSMSPVHLQYLRNMGVAATLTLSLVMNGKLWGLVACHHRTPRFVSYGIRATACLYAVVMSAQLEMKQRNRENFKAAEARRKALELLTGIRDYADLTGSFGKALGDFTELFSADGAAVLAGADREKLGDVPGEEVLTEIWEELPFRQDRGIYLSSRASDDFASLEADMPGGAGIAAINIGESAWLIFFRNEYQREINWAGNPDTSKSRDEQGRLTPRNSFALWKETVRGQSLPWDDEILVLATEIRSGIMELVRKRNLVLEQSNLELRRFAGVMAHEVKNQMQSATMALGLLRENKGLGLEPSLLELVGIGADSLDELSRFVTEILDLARTDQMTDAEDIDFGDLVKQVVEQTVAGMDLSSVTISTGDFPKVRGYRTQLFHLLSNLLRNALVHARDGDSHLEIIIGTDSEPATGTYVFVGDNGRGIDRDFQKHIFDYLFRSNHSGGGGSGIGLAFCAQIARRHGHRLWVESEPGAGAKFCFTVTPVD